MASPGNVPARSEGPNREYGEVYSTLTHSLELSEGLVMLERLSNRSRTLIANMADIKAVH